MSPSSKQSLWPFVMALIMVIPRTSWSDKPQPKTKARSVPEWVRGVPKGCRLIEIELTGTELPGARTDYQVVWTYPIASGSETTILVGDIELLTTRSERRGFCVTVALTPSQARRVEAASAHGTLRVREAGSGVLEGGRPASWRVEGLNDQTEAIEARLAACKPGAMDRPTLAALPASPREANRAVLAVPVKIDTPR